ncbi:MAG TPA: hypothetical protein VN958_12535 [Chitinophagaceae bacterium]|nr:hypothetical protein [Chitinophagaceae bacterium]
MQKFIEDHLDEIALTQFTLNSIGLGCYRNKHPELFTAFLNDIVSLFPMLTLDIPQLLRLEQTIKTK